MTERVAVTGAGVVTPIGIGTDEFGRGLREGRSGVRRISAFPCAGFETRIAVMASIDRARFLGFARPGDQVRFAVEVESLQDDAARVLGSATADGRAVASARFSFTLVEPPRLIPALYQPFWRQAMAVWRGEYPTGKND